MNFPSADRRLPAQALKPISNKPSIASEYTPPGVTRVHIEKSDNYLFSGIHFGHSLWEKMGHSHKQGEKYFETPLYRHNN